jgi:hypothetical protein
MSRRATLFLWQLLIVVAAFWVPSVQSFITNRNTFTATRNKISAAGPHLKKKKKRLLTISDSPIALLFAIESDSAESSLSSEDFDVNSDDERMVNDAPSSPPKIPPPHVFDDPVDLAVVVSWVRT